jgi:hypothetical protein
MPSLLGIVHDIIDGDTSPLDFWATSTIDNFRTHRAPPRCGILMRPCDDHLSTGHSVSRDTTRSLEVVSLGEIKAFAPHGLCLGGNTFHEQALRTDWRPVAESACQTGSAAVAMLPGQIVPCMPRWRSKVEAAEVPACDGALMRPSSAQRESRTSPPDHGPRADPTSALPRPPRKGCR